MSLQDTSEIKEKIISALKIKGPSLPVHLSREINQSILFTSAFLSELFSEKKVKISHLRVGNSPVYFLPSQEPQLEKFSQYLKSKEKEAYNLLKEKKILKDNEQDPAIRVALREIKDFAIPFKQEENIYWRYLTIPEPELKIQIKPEKKQQEISEKPKETISKSKDLEIFDKQKEKPKKIQNKKKTSNKKNEKFFNKIKDFLSKKEIEILEIESFSKNNIFLIVKENAQKKLLTAYNKKRINETEILNAHKKASELNLNYTIISFGEPTKKLNTFIQAIKNLSKIEKIK